MISAPSPTVEYIIGLEPEQMKEAIAALPKEQRDVLVGELLRHVQETVSFVLANKEQIWEDR